MQDDIQNIYVNTKTGGISFFNNGNYVQMGEGYSSDLWEHLQEACHQYLIDQRQEAIDLRNALVNLDPDKALDYVRVFAPGEWVELGEPINQNGNIYRAKMGHTMALDKIPGGEGLEAIWKPAVPEYDENSPVEEIPEYGYWPDGTERQLGADPYTFGEMVKENGLKYRSKLAVNTWPPSKYPDGWDLVE